MVLALVIPNVSSRGPLLTHEDRTKTHQLIKMRVRVYFSEYIVIDKSTDHKIVLSAVNSTTLLQCDPITLRWDIKDYCCTKLKWIHSVILSFLLSQMNYKFWYILWLNCITKQGATYRNIRQAHDVHKAHETISRTTYNVHGDINPYLLAHAATKLTGWSELSILRQWRCIHLLHRQRTERELAQVFSKRKFSVDQTLQLSHTRFTISTPPPSLRSKLLHNH